MTSVHVAQRAEAEPALVIAALRTMGLNAIEAELLVNYIKEILDRVGDRDKKLQAIEAEKAAINDDPGLIVRFLGENVRPGLIGNTDHSRNVLQPLRQVQEKLDRICGERMRNI